MVHKSFKYVMNIALASTVVFMSCSIATGQDVPTINYPGIAVVELFTSEGCSSCPPADAVLTDIAHKYPGHVIPLSFHVDYWDRLGWKDRYSSSAFSNRQYKYASAAHRNGTNRGSLWSVWLSLGPYIQ